MKGKIVNLRRARKARDRSAARDLADQNVVRFGTPKKLTDLAKARTDKASHDLDGHKRDRDRDG